MNDGASLLRAILLHPKEDTPRLMYADYLDEQGDAARAEFIRVQCELARLPKPPAPESPARAIWSAMECGLRYIALDSRAWDLWQANYKAWEGVPGMANHITRSCIRRGFIEELWPRAEYFLANAASIFAAHPVTSVRLTDREPYQGTFTNQHGNPTWGLAGKRYWLWDHERENVSTNYALPLDIYKLLGASVSPWHKQYLSREGALDALSDACVAHGRKLAGLSVEPVGAQG